MIMIEDRKNFYILTGDKTKGTNIVNYYPSYNDIDSNTKELLINSHFSSSNSDSSNIDKYIYFNSIPFVIGNDGTTYSYKNTMTIEKMNLKETSAKNSLIKSILPSSYPNLISNIIIDNIAFKTIYKSITSNGTEFQNYSYQIHF